jgi:hypothetical protein
VSGNEYSARATGHGTQFLLLHTFRGLCYNHRAMKGDVQERSGFNRSESREGQQSEEHPMSFCPVCSQKLEPKRCKLICTTCGYYLSCSDYY